MIKKIFENWKKYLGEGKRIPLDKIRPTEELGYLRDRSPQEFEEVISDIEHSFEMGEEEPLDVIYVKSKDIYKIVDGHHRFHVASDWDLDDYPVIVIGVEDE
tara:strand:+ start:444 stop:749 length:306 start_codon:yes stop_codon:yes gene_type:complete